MDISTNTGTGGWSGELSKLKLDFMNLLSHCLQAYPWIPVSRSILELACIRFSSNQACILIHSIRRCRDCSTHSGHLRIKANASGKYNLFTWQRKTWVLNFVHSKSTSFGPWVSLHGNESKYQDGLKDYPSLLLQFRVSLMLALLLSLLFLEGVSLLLFVHWLELLLFFLLLSCLHIPRCSSLSVILAFMRIPWRFSCSHSYLHVRLSDCLFLDCLFCPSFL
jgi:hypothetical protein